ncbi:hypothetical protein [Paraburkholderia elongata]|nr:hypothetical protein [Paraburkholderia elongata]
MNAKHELEARMQTLSIRTYDLPFTYRPISGGNTHQLPSSW